MKKFIALFICLLLMLTSCRTVVDDNAELSYENPPDITETTYDDKIVNGDKEEKIVNGDKEEPENNFKPQENADWVIIEKINAKESFCNEYRVSVKDATELLALLSLDTYEKGCVCMPTHRVFYNGKVYNVAIGDYYYSSHFTVDNKTHVFTIDEYSDIYKLFEKFVSKDYFIVTKKIDTDFEYSGDIKVTAKITDYLKEIGEWWPSSPDVIQFTITGKDAQELYQSVRKKTFAKYKNESNNMDVTLDIDGHTYILNMGDWPYFVSENCFKCFIEKDDEFIKIFERCALKALKEQGLDKESLANRKNLVAYENRPRIESGPLPHDFCFNSVENAVKAIKTREITVSYEERKSLEKHYSTLTEEKDRIDRISKIGTKNDSRFESFKTDQIKHFYKINDDKAPDFKLSRVSISYRSVNYTYTLNSNSKLSSDSSISVMYRRPDTFDFETDSYFNDYIEYYGRGDLTEDGFIFKDYKERFGFATIMFAVKNTVIEITGHGDMANYEALKKLCVANKVTIK